MAETPTPLNDDDPPLADWNEFLADVPPGQERQIRPDQITSEELGRGRMIKVLSFPIVKLLCRSCDGLQLFEPFPSGNRVWESIAPLPLKCRNCGSEIQHFYFALDFAGEFVCATKIGQWPLFSIDVPARVKRLIQPCVDLFTKGLRAERAGLGIGALTYYRRIVEHDWKRLIEEIIRVATQVGTPQAQIDTLSAALKQNQFSKAVEMAQDALPASLLIEGHNPLTLLYTATSVGVHAETDEWCMGRAGDIREVLTELAERIQSAVAEKKSLKDALNRLTQLRNKPPAATT